MSETMSHTILAYLLSLSDHAASLTEQDRENLCAIANEFRTYPHKDNNHFDTFLLTKIQEDIPQLKQSLDTYKAKLDQLGKIPSDYLPKIENFKELVELVNTSEVQVKSEIPDIPDNIPPDGQDTILNNFVIVISESEKPEKIVNQRICLGKLKQRINKL